MEQKENSEKNNEQVNSFQANPDNSEQTESDKSEHTNERKHSVDPKRQIEIDKYLMLGDEGRRSGIVKSVIILVVTAVIVIGFLSISVYSSLQQSDGISSKIENNRKIYSDTFRKKISNNPNSKYSIADFSFDNEKFIVVLNTSERTTKYSGIVWPQQVKDQGDAFLAQTLCHDAQNIIRRELGVDAVDYKFLYKNENIFTIYVTEDNCKALK